MTDDWIVIAFGEPPRAWGFRPNKAKSAWWRALRGKRWALELGRQLAARDIHGIIKRKQPRPQRDGRSRMPLESRYLPSPASTIGPQPAAITLRTDQPRSGGRRTYDQIHRST